MAHPLGHFVGEPTRGLDDLVQLQVLAKQAHRNPVGTNFRFYTCAHSGPPGVRVWSGAYC